jgi:hypothetical protein
VEVRANRLADAGARAQAPSVSMTRGRLAAAQSLPGTQAMTGSLHGVVVGVSGDAQRADMLAALMGDPNDYDVFIVESVARGYSRIKQLKPDVIVLFMAFDDDAACHLLSMLANDSDVSGIPVLPFVAKPEGSPFEDNIAKVDRRLSHATVAIPMN